MDDKALGEKYGTVGDILDPNASSYTQPDFIEVDGPLEMPMIEGTPDPLEPGIYFDMPDEVYHKIPAFSCSLAKLLLASPTIGWASSWLNPKKEESKKDHLTVGKAYHAMILEGVKAYEARFYPMPEKSDYPEALEKVDQVKAAIEARNEKPVSRVDAPDLGEGKTRAAKKEDWVAQLAALDRSVEIWEVIKAKHEKRARGRDLISVEDDHQIRVAARMINQDPQLAQAFKGGWAEVTLIWRDERQGVLCKCRTDYLKLKGVVDLKSFANKNDRSIRNSIIREVAQYRMSLQPAHYLPGIEAVRKLVREHGASVVHNWRLEQERALETEGLANSVDLYDERHSDQTTWAMRWAAYQEPDRWLWVFQQKGEAPVTRGLYHPLGGSIHSISQMMIVTALRTFREFTETFGVEPWLDLEEIGELTDEDIPAWGIDI